MESSELYCFVEYKNWWIPVAEEIIVKKDEKPISKKDANVKEKNVSEQVMVDH